MWLYLDLQQLPYHIWIYSGHNLHWLLNVAIPRLPNMTLLHLNMFPVIVCTGSTMWLYQDLQPLPYHSWVLLFILLLYIQS